MKRIQSVLNKSPLCFDEGCINAFLDEIFSYQKQAATLRILNQVSDEQSIEQIYVKILQPALYRIGELWLKGTITVSMEHYASAVIQQIMAQLSPLIYKQDYKINKRLVAFCVSGELHQIGIEMVSDVFEMHGWDTVNLGASAPNDDIIKTLEVSNPDLIAISATMESNINQVETLVKEVRNNQSLKQTKIIVGGNPFNLESNLYKKVGADGSAENALEAYRLGERLVLNET